MLERIEELIRGGFEYPEVTPDIPHGDMPGDKIEIGESHIAKAKVIFPELLRKKRRNGSAIFSPLRRRSGKKPRG